MHALQYLTPAHVVVDHQQNSTTRADRLLWTKLRDHLAEFYRGGASWGVVTVGLGRPCGLGPATGRQGDCQVAAADGGDILTRDQGDARHCLRRGVGAFFGGVRR